MINYQTTPTHRLMRVFAILTSIKEKGILLGQTLTQSGQIMIDWELEAIGLELDSRQPTEEFVILLDKVGLPIGFEPLNGGEASDGN